MTLHPLLAYTIAVMLLLWGAMLAWCCFDLWAKRIRRPDVIAELVAQGCVVRIELPKERGDGWPQRSV